MDFSEHESRPMDMESEIFEGLEESMFDKASDEKDMDDCNDNVEVEIISDEEEGDIGREEGINDDGVGRVTVDSWEDILQFDMKKLSPLETKRIDVGSLDLAFQFYQRYAKFNVFAARKHNIVDSKRKETIQQTSVCNKEGKRRVRIKSKEGYL